MEDKSIIRAIREGKDKEAITALYDNVLPTVKRYITKNQGDEDEALDIFQDVITQFYRQVLEHKFDEKYRVEGFIQTKCRYLWINRAKRRGRQTDIDVLDQNMNDEDSILDSMITDERKAAVNKLFNILGENCKELLLRTVVYKMKLEDVKEELGLSSLSAAKVQNFRCKKKMFELAEKSSEYRDILIG